MNRRTFISAAAFAAAAGALSLAGCAKSTAGAASGSTAGDLLAQIRAKGSVTIACEGTYMPWNYHDESDTLVGYDVEVAQHIAEKLGVTADFAECEWDGIFAGLDDGRYDIVANEVEITDERAAKYDFSDPYAYIHTAIITSADNDSIHSFEDLDGKTTANTLTSTYAALAENYGASVTGVDTLEQTLELVMQGRVDATLNADVSYYDYLKTHADAPLQIVALTEDAVVASIPMRKGDDTASLREAVNEAIQTLREDGTLTTLSEKYFGSDVSHE